MVILFDIETTFDETERVAKARLEKALSTVLDKPSQKTAGEEVSPVVVKGREVVPRTMVLLKVEGKSHTRSCRCQKSDDEVPVAICEGHKARTARRSEAQFATVEAPKDVAGLEKGETSDVSEGEGLPKIGVV